MPKPTRSEITAHNRFLRRQQTFERIYRKQYYAWLASVNSKVAKWMDANESLNPDVSTFIDGARLDSIYRRLYTRLTIEEATLSWQQQVPQSEKERKDIIDLLAGIFGTSDDGAPINLWRRLLNDYLTVRIARRIQEVEQTTVKRIATLIEKGIADGLGAREVATTIRKDTGFNRNRSLAIARTETITALNQGKYLAAQSSPYVMEKRWLPVNQPDRTRESHLDMLDSDWIRLNDDFVLTNRDGILEYALYPGDPRLSAGESINCRCGLLTRAKLNPNGRPIRKSATEIKSMKPKEFTTGLKAIDPKDGKLKDWIGPRIPAKSWEEAEKFVQENGMGYLDVDGEFVDEI